MSPQDGFPLEVRTGVRADIVRPRTEVSQGHKVTSNTWIDQSVNQKNNEEPTLTPPWVKNSNIGI